ncbi:MAG: hypothetical protein HUU03_13190 [Planctomycetaceae bacterium]|nr:hypothetical protein [Planctomycetaceae bacterium]
MKTEIERACRRVECALCGRRAASNHLKLAIAGFVKHAGAESILKSSKAEIREVANAF